MNFGLILDENGKVSSTRMTLLVMLCIFVTLIIMPDINRVPDQVWSILQSVILLCLGGTTIRSTVKSAKNNSDK